jgi:translation initiation factor 3 subunit D
MIIIFLLFVQFEPNPFYDDDESGVEPAAVAYRYRKFTLAGGIRLVTRCELHGWLSKRGEDQNITVYALNEWDSKFSDGVNWRQKIDQQRGAVLATELKNNSCKLAKWTAQSILAGADQMKLGYVSRNASGNPYEHSILATQFFKPKELAQQINLSLNNMWGIVKMICELLMKKPDGKYVLLKDPNKATVRLYSVPLSTFDEDEEEEEGEEVEGDEEEDAEEVHAEA